MVGDKAEALLKRVQLAARLGDLITTRHSRERMSSRGASAADIKRAILSATIAIDQPEEQTIRLEGGTDTDGDDLKVVVAEDRRGLRIVTVL
jgi:hypothetical protein